MIAALLGEEDTIHSSVLPHNKQGGVPTLQLHGSKNMFDPYPARASASCATLFI